MASSTFAISRPLPGDFFLEEVHVSEEDDQRIMKTLSAFLPALLLCLPAHLGAAAVLSVSAPGVVAPGDTFTVNVNITGVADLFGFQFDLGFDAAKLNAISSGEGSFLPVGGPTAFVPGTIDNTTGSVIFTADTLLSAVPGVSGAGILGSIDFKALAVGVSTLAPSNPVLLDSALNTIEVDLQNGSVTVRNGPTSAVPEPSFLPVIAVGLVLFAIARRVLENRNLNSRMVKIFMRPVSST